MDQMNMSVGADGGDAIQLIAESELSRFNKSLNLMYTNAAQQEKSSGDLFFNFMHKIEGAKIDWGAKSTGSSGGVGTPRGRSIIKSMLIDNDLASLSSVE